MKGREGEEGGEEGRKIPGDRGPAAILQPCWNCWTVGPQGALAMLTPTSANLHSRYLATSTHHQINKQTNKQKKPIKIRNIKI